MPSPIQIDPAELDPESAANPIQVDPAELDPEPVPQRSLVARAADAVRMAEQLVGRGQMATGEAQAAAGEAFGRKEEAAATAIDRGIQNLGKVDVPYGEQGGKDLHQQVTAFDVPGAAQTALALGTAPVGGEMLAAAPGAALAAAPVMGAQVYLSNKLGADFREKLNKMWPSRDVHARLLKGAAALAVDNLPWMFMPGRAEELALKGALIEDAGTAAETPAADTVTGEAVRETPEERAQEQGASAPSPKSARTTIEINGKKVVLTPEQMDRMRGVTDAGKRPEPIKVKPEDVQMIPGFTGPPEQEPEVIPQPAAEKESESAEPEVVSRLPGEKTAEQDMEPGKYYPDPEYVMVAGRRVPYPELSRKPTYEDAEIAEPAAAPRQTTETAPVATAKPEPAPEPVAVPEGATTAEKLAKLPSADTNTVAAKLDKLPAGEAKKVPLSMIEADPERFQYKLNTNKEGAGRLGSTAWNQGMAGTALGYYDPERDQLYIVNGHNRLSLAKRVGQPYLEMDILDGGNALPFAETHNVTPSDARAAGAIQNIGEGKGDAVDAASYLREAKATPEDLSKIGIDLSTAQNRDALALQKLSDNVFHFVKTGDISPQQGAILGSEIANPRTQDAVFKWLKGRESAGKKVSNEVLREVARDSAEAAETTENQGQGGLFGEDFMKRSLFEERATVMSAIKERIGRERAAFSNAVRNKERLEGAGNVLTDENTQLAKQAGERLGILEAKKTGPINEALNRAAQELAKYPKAKSRIIDQAYQDITKAVDELRATQPPAEPEAQAGMFPVPVTKAPAEPEPQPGMFPPQTQEPEPKPAEESPAARELAKWRAERSAQKAPPSTPPDLQEGIKLARSLADASGTLPSEAYSQLRKLGLSYDEISAIQNLLREDVSQGAQGRTHPKAFTFRYDLRRIAEGADTSPDIFAIRYADVTMADLPPDVLTPEILTNPAAMEAIQKWMGASDNAAREAETKVRVQRSQLLDKISKLEAQRGAANINPEQLDSAIAGLRAKISGLPKRKAPAEPGFSLGASFPGGPQLAKALEPEISYWANRFAEGGRGLVDALRKTFAPQMRGPLAKRTGQIVVEARGEQAGRIVPDEVLMRPMRDVYEDVPEDQWRERYRMFYGPYERGGMPLGLPDKLKPLIQRIRQAEDERWQLISKLRTQRGKGPLAYLDNYLAHLYVDDPAKVRETLYQLGRLSGTSLEKGASLAHQRKYLQIVDAMRAGLTPRYKNPIDQVLAGLRQQDAYIASETMFRNLYDAGLIRFFPQGTFDENWKKIPDDFFDATQSLPDVGGIVKRGEWRAPGPVVDVLAPHLGPSAAARDDAAGKLLKHFGPGTAAARFNAWRVGFSTFHFLNENNAGMAQLQGSGVARALAGVLTGNTDEMRNGMTLFMKGLPPEPFDPVSGLHDYFVNGSKIMKALVEPGSQGAAYDQAVKAALTAGMRFKPEQAVSLGRALTDAAHELFHPMARDAVRAEIKDMPALSRYVKGASHELGNVADLTSTALMNHYVPRVKLGAFYRLAQQEMEHYVNKAGGQLPWVKQREILQNVAAHVDSVFGQMVEDNLFMSRTMKDVLHLGIAYPGWNIGSLRLAWKATQGVGRAMTFRGLDSQQRLAIHFMMGLLTSQGIQNALLQRVLAGVWPNSIKDLMQPRDGGTDPYGNPMRIASPSYLRTYVGITHHPLSWATNITAPAWRAMEDIYNNRESYTGRQIVDPQAPLHEQAAQAGEYAFRFAMPFSVSNVQRMGDVTGTGKQALGVAGYSPVPAQYLRTPAENYVMEQAAAQAPRVGLSAKQYDARQAQHALEDALRSEKPLNTALDAKHHKVLDSLEPDLRKKVEEDAAKAAKLPRMMNLMRRMPLHQVLETYEIARKSGDVRNQKYAGAVIHDKAGRMSPENWNVELDKMGVSEQQRYRQLLMQILRPDLPEQAAASGPET